MTSQKIKIFCDFDGTITTKDVGEYMFEEFGDIEKAYEIFQRWVKKEIDYAQVWTELAEQIKDLKAEELDAFLETIDIQYGFSEFIQFCKSNNFEFTILSDGMDYYIKKILNHNKFEDLNFFSNNFVFTSEGPKFSFPYTDEECKDCATCKRNILIDKSSDDDITIYIGDGLSDTCPAQYVDFIFAKKSLLKFCEKERISYYPFKNFKDVIARIKPMLEKKRIKKRHQAELKRKALYALG
jgi:2,3-diketo-5-methylthio-1-phosphopentane phosphatase